MEDAVQVLSGSNSGDRTTRIVYSDEPRSRLHETFSDDGSSTTTDLPNSEASGSTLHSGRDFPLLVPPISRMTPLPSTFEESASREGPRIALPRSSDSVSVERPSISSSGYSASEVSVS